MQFPALRRAISALLLSTSLWAGPVQAAPEGPTVVSGQATVQTQDSTTLIRQLTDRAIIDWNRFGIASGEVVRFLQPSELAVILNRVGLSRQHRLGQHEAALTEQDIEPGRQLLQVGQSEVAAHVCLDQLLDLTAQLRSDTFHAADHDALDEHPAGR